MSALDRLRLRSRSRRDARRRARAGAALRARAHRAARRRDRPRQRVPARPVAGARRAGPARHHGAGALGRRRPRLPRAHRRDGGDLARLGRGRAVLRRAFEPVRQPAAPERQRRAARPLPAAAGVGRARRRAGDVRAGRGFRCRVDAAARREARRSLSPHRPQDVDHQRSRRRRARRLCAHRSEGAHARASPPSSSRRASPASARRRSWTSSACAAPAPASWCSRTARCRRTTCSAAWTMARAC